MQPDPLAYCPLCAPSTVHNDLGGTLSLPVYHPTILPSLFYSNKLSTFKVQMKPFHIESFILMLMNFP